MLKHYVEFSYTGFFFKETEVKEIARRDPKLVTVPENAFAYRFFDRNEVVEDGETLIGRDKNHSPYTYFGKEYTLEEVKNSFLKV